MLRPSQDELLPGLRVLPTESPAELAEPRITDTEMVTHLVDDRPSNLLDDLGFARADRADGTPVQVQEADWATVVLNRDGHVVHELEPVVAGRCCDT